MDPHDLQLLVRVGTEMKRQILSTATPEEATNLYCAVDDGVSLLPLLCLLYGNCGEAETAAAMDVDGVVVHFYLGILQSALQALEIPQTVLQNIYDRNQ